MYLWKKIIKVAFKTIFLFGFTNAYGVMSCCVRSWTLDPNSEGFLDSPALNPKRKRLHSLKEFGAQTLKDFQHPCRALWPLAGESEKVFTLFPSLGLGEYYPFWSSNDHHHFFLIHFQDSLKLHKIVWKTFKHKHGFFFPPQRQGFVFSAACKLLFFLVKKSSV